jgi:hypothetical protein
MTTDVKITLKPDQIMPDVFDWIHSQGWKHIVEWRWFHAGTDRVRDPRYTFQFDKEEHATLFSLKWL